MEKVGTSLTPFKYTASHVLHLHRPRRFHYSYEQNSEFYDPTAGGLFASSKRDRKGKHMSHSVRNFAALSAAA